MNNTIYLSGAHRTGKSYLATIAAHCLSINFKEATNNIQQQMLTIYRESLGLENKETTDE